MQQGLIVKSIANLFTVEYNGNFFECNASTKLKQKKNKLIIGDQVVFEIREENKGYITELIPRYNEFIRPRVANVRFSLLVFSLKQPNMNWNLLDKFIVSCEHNSVTPIILITKRDLCNEDELKYYDELLSYYKNYYHIFNNQEENIFDKVKDIVENDITFLMGQSGVGKSTFLNKFTDKLDIKTNDISLKLNRGKHTTRHTQLYKVNSMNIIDTPGFGMLDIFDFSIEELKSCFIDFFEMSKGCKFGAKCNHISEKQCNVKDKLLKGEIIDSRYDTYKELYLSVKNKKW